MRYAQPLLRFYQVQVSRAEEILAWMEAVADNGVTFWTRSGDRCLPRDEWLTAIQAWMQEDWRPLAKWAVSFSIRFDDLPGVSLYFSVDQFDDDENLFQSGTLLDFEFKDERHLVEPTMQRLSVLGRTLYPLTRPWLGCIDEGDSNVMLSTDGRKLRLKHIGWVNFFGPAYVEKYGRDFLLGLPGYKTELLPDGGVFHQLSPTFVARSEQEARALRRQVIAYCADHGRKVTCQAPYVIPGLTPQPQPREAGTDAEVRAYLQQALATTLVLTDGTRVKPVFIPWEELTPGQRQMALEAIRQAAIAEIRRPGRQRIRFEFNAIPDELDQMLADLAGRDNPDFEWAEVTMGEGL
jgi:hypothetical protein